jgi:hypothetical protein
MTADNAGQFSGLSYTVPTTTITGTYQIIANLGAMTVAQAPFTVTE